jgi:hypothetical protein
MGDVAAMSHRAPSGRTVLLVTDDSVDFSLRLLEETYSAGVLHGRRSNLMI